MAETAQSPPRPGEPIAWRIDRARYADMWDSGEGAYQFGGRWNSPGVRVVYCSFDAAAAILEMAVHKGFRQMAAVPHVLTSAFIGNPAAVHFVAPADVPKQAWLQPGEHDAEQRAFGDELIRRHRLVAIPSVVSRNSWNLLIAVPPEAGSYRRRDQEPFLLDPRLQATGAPD
jgi:RES domain-containing protein